MKRLTNLFFAVAATSLFVITPVFGGESTTYTDDYDIIWDLDYGGGEGNRTITIHRADTTNLKYLYVVMDTAFTIGGEKYFITKIEDGTFEGCMNFDGIVLPRTVTEITGWAFRNMGGTVYVNAPDTLAGKLVSGKYGTTNLEVVYYFTPQDIPLSYSTFSKSQTVKGALAYANYTPSSYSSPFDGMVADLKFAKASKGKNGARTVKFSAVFTGPDGSKQRAKATLNLNGSNATTASQKIHLKLSNSTEEDFYLSVANGKVSLKGTSRIFSQAKIGGVLSSSVTKLYLHEMEVWEPFSNPNFFGSGWKVQKDLFNIPVITVLNGRRFSTPKGASYKFKKGKGGSYKITSSGGIDNKSAMKISYNTKTGQFKGTLKIYALNFGNTKFKSHTVNISGVMIGDYGNGAASMKKPKGGPWRIWLDTSIGVG